MTKLHKFDVEYNMKSPQAWIKLADHLDNIKDIALNDSAKALSVETYRNSAMFKMVKIVQVSIRRALIGQGGSFDHDSLRWTRGDGMGTS